MFIIIIIITFISFEFLNTDCGQQNEKLFYMAAFENKENIEHTKNRWYSVGTNTMVALVKHRAQLFTQHCDKHLSVLWVDKAVWENSVQQKIKK